MSTKQQVGVGCLMLVAALVTAGLALTLGGLRGFGGSTAYEAPVDNAAGLSSGARVSVRGVDVGAVTGLELVDGMAMVHFEVDRDVVLKNSATAAIRARSLLGEKYLALELGEGEALVAGTPLPEIARQYEVDELFAVMTPLLQAIDPVALEKASAALTQKLEDDPELLSRLVDDAEQVLTDVRTASAELPAMTKEGRLAIAEARSALSVLQARGDELRPVIARADAVITELDAAAAPLPATVAEAKAALEEARVLVHTLQTAGASVQTIVDRLEGFDRDTVHTILREEGIRVRLFSSGKRDK